jgi:succinate dehydrogenase / fumarate reductase cytochrome b subunit
VSGWIDPRGRAHGGRGLALHRLTGLVIIFYLYLHLGVLSMLLIGRSAWSSFLRLVTAKGFLALEVVLIVAVLVHGLNGIRVALVGSGIAVRRERALWWSASAVATVAASLAALHVLGAF